MMCKHGLVEGQCGWCNNNGFEAKKKEKTSVVDPVVQEYKKKEHLFKHRDDLWSRDEIEVVYSEFKSLCAKKEIRKKTYEIALVLERTQKAVGWMRRHVFSNNKELHRGAEVISFRQDMSLT